MGPNLTAGSVVLPYWIPLLLITLYAVDRFSTPSENRAFTTAMRYYSATATYIGIYWIAFFVIHKYPLLIELILNSLGAAKEDALPPGLDQSSTTLMVAVLLSILLPKIPLLSELDRKLKTFLQKMADIPFEARRLSKEIQAAPFAIPDHLLYKLQERFVHSGFDARDIAIGDGDPAKKLWTKIFVLLFNLESWETDTGVGAFILERQNQYRRIKERYRRLGQMARSCFDLSRSEAGAVGKDIISRASSKFHASFMAEADDLLSDICDFISQGVLKCRLTHHSRVATMARMGFQLGLTKGTDVLNPNRVVGFTGFLLLLLISNFILWSPDVQDSEGLLLKITMIVAVYASAVICGVAPKEKWTLFVKDSNGQLPFTGYLLSGLMAAVSSVAICMVFKTLIFTRGDPHLGQAAQMAWTSFSTRSYPYLLMAFSTAAIVSYQIDQRLPHLWPELLKRSINGIIQALGTVASAILVYWWLKSIRQPPSLLMHIQISSVIGFTIGFTVPCWYWRGACKPASVPGLLGEKEIPAPVPEG